MIFNFLQIFLKASSSLKLIGVGGTILQMRVVPLTVSVYLCVECHIYEAENRQDLFCGLITGP